VENMRRKHNYLPFVMELVKILAENEKLVDLVKQAKCKAIERESKKN
jgi:ubiquitin carboxyl-terminal hydrolase L5